MIGDNLAVVWSDGREDILPFGPLREACPCALCKGEPDILGQVSGGGGPIGNRGRELVAYSFIGAYAVQLTWGDGHNSGLYSLDYLRKLGAETIPSGI